MREENNMLFVPGNSFLNLMNIFDEKDILCSDFSTGILSAAFNCPGLNLENELSL